MPVFQFTALDKSGATQKGSIDADNAKQVRQQLRAQGLMPVAVDISTANKTASGIKTNKSQLSQRNLALITRQLATLLEGAVPLEQALQLMAKQHEKDKVKTILLAVSSKIKEGYSLADSMAAFPQTFSEIYRATIAAGEHAGSLGSALTQLADYLDASKRNMEKIQLALIYPLILMFASFMAVSFLLGYVMPNIIKVFQDSDQKLPFVTIAVMNLSYFFSHYLIYAILFGAVTMVLFLLSLKNEKARYQFHKRIYELPVIGKWQSAINIAKFLRTFSTLHRNGVQIIKAVEMSSKVVGNLYLREKFIRMTQKIQEGKSLSSGLEEIEYFPPTALYIIASGESSGKLDDMLDRAARDQELLLQNKVAVLIGLFEPLMILVMGVIVLIFVMAILLPILNFSQVVK